MNKLQIFALFLVSIAFSACEWLDKFSEETIIIAKVEGRSLTLEEIKNDLKIAVSKEDSIAIIENASQDWIKQQLLFKQAEINLQEDLKEIDKKVQNYRNSLVIYAYEKAFVNEKLDTVVTQKEIEAYYKANMKDFELKDYIVKIKYIKLSLDAPKKAQVEKALFYEEEKSEAFIEDYCLQFANNYSLDDDVWLYFDELLREIPIKTYDIENFLRKNKIIRFEDDEYLYLLKIKDYRLKEAVSPLEFEKANITNIILNIRKLKLINALHTDIVKDAFVNGKAEIIIP